jgi:hypothetical protein
MFHRPPKKYSEYLVNVEQSIDWILKMLWRVKKGEGIVTKINAGSNITIDPVTGTGEVTISSTGGGGTQNLQEVTDEGNTTTNIIDTAGTKSDYFQLDTAANPTLLPGMFGWNDADGTANLRLKGNNVTLQLGQETLARVVNKTGANLLESQYKVVRVRIASEGGAQGQRLAVVLAQGNNDPDSVTTLGIVTENISNNQEGFITVFGNVNEINTTGSLQGETWVDGDVLYLSPTTPGSLTKVKPVAPDHSVVMGYVIYAHANHGKIFVKVDNGYELDELHNVKITSVANNNLLQYDSTLQVWKNVTPAVAVPTPTLDQVTTAGNTTTNAITVGGLTVATNLIYTDLVNNRVFIGDTTSPQVAKLTIKSSDNSASGLGFVIYNTSTATNSYSAFKLYANNGAAEGQFYVDGLGGSMVVRTYTNHPMIFGTNATERLRIFANGNVGIGTTTDAGYKLDVNGTARIQNDLIAFNRFHIQNGIWADYGTGLFGRKILSNESVGGLYSVNFRLPHDTGKFFFQSWNTNSTIFDIGMSAATLSIGTLITKSSITAASLLAQGVYFNNTLVAAANNDVLVGLDINPTFTNGAFTGVTNIPLRVGTSSTTPSGSPLIFMGKDFNGETNFQISNSTNGTSSLVGFRLSGASGRSSIIAEFALGYTGNTEWQGHLLVEPNDAGGKHGIIFSIPNVSPGSGFMIYTGGRTSSDKKLTFFASTGNLLIQNGGTHTDSGQKLQVIGSVFIKGTNSLSSTKVFEVQNGAGASIMDFRNATYAFFGCGQGGGSNSGFIFNYSNTSYTQFAGYNYGAGAGSYKPILMDTDTGGRNQGIFVNFGVTTNTPPNSDTEFGVLGRTSDSTTYISRFRNSGNTDKFAIRADGALFTNTLQGYSGTLNIPTNPPGTSNITITNGLITNIA